MAKKRKFTRERNYEQIFRPYGPHLERDAGLEFSPVDSEDVVIGSPGMGVNIASGEATSKVPVKSEKDISNVWITNKLRSKNWKPKRGGFYLDGEKGYAEFADIFVTGDITLDEFSKIMGGQTDYNTGTGFFLGYSGGAYKFSLGDPQGDYVTWDGSSLSVMGVQYGVSTFVAGTDITAGQSLFVALETGGIDATRGGIAVTAPYLNMSSAAWWAGEFTVPNGCYRLRNVVINIDSAGENFTVSIRNSLTGSDLTAGSVYGSTGSLTVNMSDLSVNPGETLYAVIRCDNSAQITSTSHAARTEIQTYKSLDSGTSWTVDSNYISVQIEFIYGTTGKAFPTTAAVNSQTINNFIGFALNTVNENASIKVAVSGAAPLFSGLNIGSTYYLSDTHGDISTTSGTVSKMCGKAIKTDTLAINIFG